MGISLSAERAARLGGRAIRTRGIAACNPDKAGTKRWFTNSAAPYEGIMQITTRVTESSFKQALSKLEEGGELQR